MRRERARSSRTPPLASCYREIAKDGRDAFYQGPIAEQSSPSPKSVGGLFSKKDFDEHTSHLGRTGHDKLSRLRRLGTAAATARASPPCRCSTCSKATTSRQWGRHRRDYWHLLIEAKKLAYEDRAKFYADPEFAKVPVAELISKPYAERRRKLIDMRHAPTTTSSRRSEARQGRHDLSVRRGQGPQLRAR